MRQGSHNQQHVELDHERLIEFVKQLEQLIDQQFDHVVIHHEQFDHHPHNRHDAVDQHIRRRRRGAGIEADSKARMADAKVIAGRYRLEGKLGSGGMSTVQLATDERLERRVAVKLLAEHLADDPAFVSRFKHEALAAARLVHPNIVQVFDSGLDEASHRHFIVMEYVEGSSCAELLRDRGRLPAGEVAHIAADAAEGLDYAHRNGVIHRDVKPGNLLVGDSGHVKLADFGIAKATEQSSVTQVGSVLGTAAYLAPEQARGEEADPRCDIYALGVVAYQLASGRLPYEATSLSELALKQQQEVPPTLVDLDPSIPHWFSDAVAAGLALDPNARPQEARQFAEMLRGDAGSPRTAPTRVVAGAAAAGTAAHTVAAPRQPRPPKQQDAVQQTSGTGSSSRGKRVAAVLAAAALIAAGAGTAIFLTQPESQQLSLRPVSGSDAGQAIQSMRDLVDQNTR